MFWLTKFYVTGWTLWKQWSGNPWANVQGVFLPVHPSIGFNTLRWIADGTYEIGEFQLIERHLEPTDIVMEIGTGLGFISTYCAKKIGSGRVFSFEANPYNIDTARRVYAKNGVQPSCHLALLGEGNGKVSFPVDRKSRLASSALLEQQEVVTVDQWDINQTIERITPTFLVMDIEGAESAVLPMIQFQTIRKIQIELHPHLLGQSRLDELVALVQHAGFRVAERLTDGRNYYFERL